jgi:hypothetical protein
MFSASAIGWMVLERPSQAHQRYISRAASLPDRRIKDGDYGEGDRKQNVNPCSTRPARPSPNDRPRRTPAAGVHVSGRLIRSVPRRVLIGG